MTGPPRYDASSKCDPRERTEPAMLSLHDPRAHTSDYDPAAARSGAAAAGEHASSSQDMHAAHGQHLRDNIGHTDDERDQDENIYITYIG